MKSFSFVALFALIILSACTVNNPAEDQAQDQLSARAVVGHVNQDGSYGLTIDPGILEQAFIETYGYEKTENLRIEENEAGYFLQGNAVVNEETYLNFAIELNPDNDGGIGFFGVHAHEAVPVTQDVLVAI